ncbi:hypothetical protein RY831_27540 [Noviherbaspirillum sp. CPCC 100848]|uniref:Response regulatory domain-containing protein n=1 Tax=Noviherbaspirillum album TaxID=3080276 RepID=A0ABU6JGW3_9BURK|nr:hypothetical protein [Noviherbaspirillum sp. CPCC 100848]MEC4722917.1 hypothetical protein [Noviherbaspirillum sp. CPCC 100848]
MHIQSMTQNTPKTLLIAVREDDISLVQAFVGDAYRIVFCHTIAAAKAALEEGVDIVVAGVHFDDGAVFDLLQHVRSSRVFGKLPFFVMLDTSRRYTYSRAIVHGMRSASKALGATGFTDVGGMIEKFGREEAVKMLRRGVDDLLGRPGT